jgi:ribosomal protein S12
MPQVELQATGPKSVVQLVNGKGEYTLTMANPSSAIAFFVHVKLTADNDSVTALFDDNDISLLPSQSKTLTAGMTCAKGSSPQSIQFEISGWNCPAQSLSVRIRR